MRLPIADRFRGWFAAPRNKATPNPRSSTFAGIANTYRPRGYRGDGYDQDRIDNADRKRARKNVRRRMENHQSTKGPK